MALCIGVYILLNIKILMDHKYWTVKRGSSKVLFFVQYFSVMSIEATEDAWAIVKTLENVHNFSEDVHEIAQSFGTIIDAIDTLIRAGEPPTYNQSQMLSNAQKQLCEYWLYMRYVLRKEDEPKPSPREDSMMISIVFLPWLAMSKLHTYRMLCEFDVTETQADDKGAFMVWKRRPFATDILKNVEGNIVNDIAPCMMKLPDVIAVFHLITSKWRSFHFGHYQRLYEYTELLLDRLFLFTALNENSPKEFLEALNLLDRGKFMMPEGVVYELEMHAHVFMYNIFVARLFEIKPFCEWPGFDETQYIKTQFRLGRWLRRGINNGTFSGLRSRFASDMRDLCARPTQRERMIRKLGLRRVSTREILMDEDVQVDNLNDYLSSESLVQRTLMGEIGTVFERQILFVRVFDMFLNSPSMEWPFIQDYVLEESELANLETFVDLSRCIEKPKLIFVCGTHMLVLDGCLYPVINFLDAMTQFILVTRETGMAMLYDGFYNHFLDIHAYQPSQEELETVDIDNGVYDISLADRRSRGFVEDSDSDIE